MILKIINSIIVYIINQMQIIGMHVPFVKQKIAKIVKLNIIQKQLMM